MGRGRELERTLRDFRWTFVLSFIFMYLLLAAQFEHLVHPLTILFSLPLAVPFGLVSLWLGGETLNLYSALGILVLFGVVKKAVDPAGRPHEPAPREGHGPADGDPAGQPRPAAADPHDHDRLRGRHAAAADRLGAGAEERRSIAVLAVGGQTLSLLLTLLAVPVVYSFLDDVGDLVPSQKKGGSHRRRAIRRRRDAAARRSGDPLPGRRLRIRRAQRPQADAGRLGFGLNHVRRRPRTTRIRIPRWRIFGPAEEFFARPDAGERRS